MKTKGYGALPVWLALLVMMVMPGAVWAQHFIFAPTETNHSLLIEYPTLNDALLEEGDEVGVFTPGPSGICAGSGIVDGEGVGIAAWGDNPLTPVVDGFVPGDLIEFRIWDASTGSEWVATPFWFEGPAEWTVDGSSVLSVWALDDNIGTGMPVPVVDVLDFGTIGERGEDDWWWQSGGLINMGDGFIVITGGDVNGLPVEMESYFPTLVPPGGVYTFGLGCRGGQPIDGEIEIHTNQGPVLYQVRARTHDGGAMWHYPSPVNTGMNHSVLVEGSSLNEHRLEFGDEIAVFGQDSGVLAGRGIVDDWYYNEGNPVGIPVWGDDPGTPEVDGLAAGEAMRFELWRRYEGVPFHTAPESGTVNWEANGVSVVHLSNNWYIGLGEVTYDQTQIEFPATKTGNHVHVYRHVTNTSTTGWVQIQRVPSVPEEIFHSYPNLYPPMLPPGANWYSAHIFTPEERMWYEGTTGYEIVTGSGNAALAWDASGQGLGAHYWWAPNTGVNHSVVVEEATLHGWPLRLGDEIGVFTPDGQLAGAGTYNGHWPVGIAVWGDDGTTPEVDGFQAGQQMEFRIWHYRERRTWFAEPEFLSGSSGWMADGITSVALRNVPIPWDFSVFSAQNVPENTPFESVNLDDAVLLTPPPFWNPDDLSELDDVDPESMTWSFGYASEPPAGMDLDVAISTERVLTVAVPDSEWVGEQIVRLYVEDSWGQKDSTDIAYSVEQVNDPPKAFDLFAPADGATLALQNPELSWEATEDVDWTEDDVSYTLEWALNSGFTNMVSVNVGDNTSYQFTEETFASIGAKVNELDDLLPDEVTVYWRVKASDNHAATTPSGPEPYWSFSVHIADPPTAFDLLEPTDDATLDFVDPPEYVFKWRASSDPDPAAGDITYHFHLDFGALGSFNFDIVDDTTYSVNLYDDLALDPWTSVIQADWWVEAESQGDVIECNTRYTVSFAPDMSVGDEVFQGVPTEYRIERVYPNPFNPTANVVIALANDGHLKVEVYNMLGQRVKVLADQQHSAGYFNYVLNGEDLSSGIYFVRAVVPGKLDQLQKVILVR